MKLSSLRPICVATCTAGLLAVGTFSMPALASASHASVTQDRADQRQDEHRHFADHDRQAAQTWYEQHRRTPPAGLRDSDRLDATLSAKIVEGAVLDTEMRRHVHPVPADLIKELPAPRRGEHYYFVDGQLCLVDSHYQVEDVIRLHER